ncbi:MAG TPA: DUF3592 domain-containing protein [Polyangiaceae bacterium]|nr:DUF3592 domain-containing protein [Polyangiaceae bacterium]
MSDHEGVLVVGGFVMGLGVVVGAILQRRARRRRPAEGTVVELKQGPRELGDDRHSGGLAPVVEFQPSEGGPARRFVGVYSKPPAYTVGQKVKVRYEPTDPERAFVDYGLLGVLGPAAIFFAVGLAIMALAFAD